MIFTTILCSFCVRFIALIAADNLTVNTNWKPANLSDAHEMIGNLKDKLSTCEQELRENRWPLLVRGEIDRLFDRYGSGITLAAEELQNIGKIPEDTKKRKIYKTKICERMLNLSNYAEMVSLKAHIDEAHQKDNEITAESFCVAIAESYECISANGAPYLRLSPGERVPQVLNLLTADHMNKYINILMKNVNEKPIKEHKPQKIEESNTNNSTTNRPANISTTVAAGKETSGITVEKGTENSGTTVQPSKNSLGTTVAGSRKNETN